MCMLSDCNASASGQPEGRTYDRLHDSIGIRPLRVPPHIQHSFSLACKKAAILAQNGQAAPLPIPLPFDWALHLLAAGAKPSFLIGKLQPGYLAHAARIFGLADPNRMSAFFLDSRETAALDKDELSPLLPLVAAETAPRMRL